jgi:hypothetical protein
MTEMALTKIKGLTNREYDMCREEAIDRVKTKAGERPQRKDFLRNYEPLFSILDIFALLVGLSAWAISSAHILIHAGQMSFASYQTVNKAAYAGTLWDATLYGNLHQIGFIVLSETAMILFAVMWAANKPKRRQGQHVLGYMLQSVLSIPFWLAVITAVFVVVANVQSGIGALESILPPAVTIGLGIYAEGKLAELIRRRQEITARYLQELSTWETAQRNIEHHPDFLPFFRQALALRIQRKNREELPLVIVRRSVAREMQREISAYEDDSHIIEQVQEALESGVNFTQAALPQGSPLRQETSPIRASNGNGVKVTQG